MDRKTMLIEVAFFLIAMVLAWGSFALASWAGLVILMVGIVYGTITDFTTGARIIWWHFREGHWMVNPDFDADDYAPAKALKRLGIEIMPPKKEDE